ncbi:ABC transporter permease [Oceanobacillus limi]|nr:ABC transporter permease [Oceanobacillus limi]
MRWNSLLVFYLKQIGKSKLYMGASFLVFLLLITRLIIFFANEFNPEAYGQLPGEIAMIVQMISLFYIIFFFRLQSNELLYGIQAFFVDGYRIMVEKISSMFVAHTIIQGMMLAVTYLIFAVTYFAVGIEISYIYLSLFRFLLLYMFFPFVLSMMYGIVVAMLFGKNKISFFLILLIWIVTGSMVSELFVDFFSSIQANEWRSLLFIGLNSVQHVYQSYIGFDMHWGNELKLLTWFLVITGAILILSLRWTLIVRERNWVLMIVFFIAFVTIATANGSIELSTKAFSRADQTIEVEYYKDLDNPKTDLRYEIEAYTISMNDHNVTVQIDFSKMNTKNPTFQLYHAYPIKWIKEEDELVDFKRSGDILKVNLLGYTDSLTFQYEIIDTQLIPYTNSNIALLADKAWYPKKRASHMYEENELIDWIELTEDFIPEENYVFTLQVREPLFTNLPKKGEVYHGNTQAVTLIYGQGNQLTYDDYLITYPADWPKMEERVPEVLFQLDKTITGIKRIAPTTVDTLPSNIVFSNFGLSSFMIKDHLVYNTGYLEAVNSEISMKDLHNNLIRFIVPQKGSNLLFDEWVTMSGEYIRDITNGGTNMFGLSPNFGFLSEAEHNVVLTIYNKYNQLNLEQKQQFLREWYRNMNEDWTWDQVLELVERGR